MPVFKDITGQRFGRLTVIDISKDRRGKNQKIQWVCCCDCGATANVITASLKDGTTRSCGCLHNDLMKEHSWNLTHGQSRKKNRTPAYRSWRSMLSRCRDLKLKNYGERGIAVCKRWEKFENFYEDMGDRPLKQSLERIDNNGNYEPGNCRWATLSEQSCNRRKRQKGLVRSISKFTDQELIDELIKRSHQNGHVPL